MRFTAPREVPLRARLREINELVQREETERALTRLNRIETERLNEEERLRVLLLRCWVHLETQQIDELAECLEAAIALDPDHLEVQLLHAHLLAHTGQERRAVREAAHVARISKVEEHAARAYMIVGLALYRTRHFGWAIKYSERSEAFYRWSDQPLLASWVSINLGLCYKALSEYDVALTFIRRASHSLPAQGYKKVKFRALLNEGVVLMLLGEITSARAAFVSAMNSEHGASHLHVCLTLNNLGHTFRMQGNLKMALEYYEQALVTATEHHLERQACISLFWSGETYTDAGHFANAAHALEKAETIARRRKHGGLLQEVLRRRGELFAKQGDLRSAQSSLLRAQRLTKTLRQPRDQALLQRALLLTSATDVSDTDINDLLQEFRRLGDRYEFSKSVLLLLEAFPRQPRQSSWLADVEKEARFYIAAMGLAPWQNRLDAALHRISPHPTTLEDFQQNREAFERNEIETALLAAAGVTSKAAQLLGMGRNTLAQKIRIHKIDRSQFVRNAQARAGNHSP